MKKPVIYTLICLLLIGQLAAQTKVRAWYAKGQVWVVWETPRDDSSVYEIYESNDTFTSVKNANLIGTLFYNEWKAGALRDQLKQPLKRINFNIPKGDSTYRLGPDEGVFVNTPHNTGKKYYGVVKKGDSIVNAHNISKRLRHYYLPDTDPVQCHAQYDIRLPNNFKGRYYYMWADGRQDYLNSRSDFPVMANSYKNGMPSMFLVSEGKEMDTTAGKKIPATLWLHGGGGSATQSIPTSREQVNIKPVKGILVSHNDDFFRIDAIKINNSLVDTLLGFDANTWFFGWAKNENPFDNIYYPIKDDTIINYTQRRLIWINDWLIKNYNVDPNLISVNGHSMGSAGAVALMKAFPEKFATATIFNSGLAGPDEEDEDGSQGAHLFGIKDSNLCTNLIRRDGNVVRIYQAFNLNDRNSTGRDLPVVRMFHGKNDDRGVMRWDSLVVAEYKKADTLGWGMQLYWSERKHGLETCWEQNDHWSDTVGANRQTFRDNVGYEETWRTDISYPGFFNHGLDNKNHDPGDGTTGTDILPATDSSGVGHDWGTWGGYHEWNRETIVDSATRWRVTAWLIDSAAFRNDISPNDFLTADVSLRRPQQFKPVTGTWVHWFVIDSITGDTLQTGSAIVKDDDLVVIPGVKVYKANIRKVYIELKTSFSAPQALKKENLAAQKFVSKTPQRGSMAIARLEQNLPNPFAGASFIHYYIPPRTKNAQLLITDNSGKMRKQITLNAEKSVVNIDASILGSGMYNYTLLIDGKLIESKRMAVIH